MIDSLDYDVKNGVLIISVTGSDNLKKAIYTSVERPWLKLTRADVTLIQKLIEKLAKAKL